MEEINLNETVELILTVVIFGAMFSIVFFLMFYWMKKGTVVDERDKKWYKKNKESSRK